MLMGGALIIFAIVLSSRLAAEQPVKPRPLAEGA